MKFRWKYINGVGFIIALIMLVIRLFIGEWVYVPSGSMFPTVSPNETVWNSKFAYGAVLPRSMIETPVLNLLCLIPAIRQFDRGVDWGYHRVFGGKKPKRMDVIIFRWESTNTQMYIKRIIGIPGDTLQIKQGVVYINDTRLEEEGNRIQSWDDYGPVIVNQDCYFVMGDCRNNSADSRNNGLVKFQNIIGEVLLE